MIRKVKSDDAAKVADFLDSHTLLNRWLVSFFRHFERLPREAAPYWSLWMHSRDAREGTDPLLVGVVVHYFPSATSYLAFGESFQPEAVEELLENEIMPERVLIDRAPLTWWKGVSQGFFSRVHEQEELLVLELLPGELSSLLVPEAGFRPAIFSDRQALREFEQLYALELGEEDPESDLASLIAEGLAFVLEENGQILGTVRSNLSDGKYIQIGGVYIHPRFRGRGLGGKLVAGLCHRIHQEGLGVILFTSRKNLRALETYRTVGFREVGSGLSLQFSGDAWEKTG
jgi:ribosomal protein S18 acetylase RimI-like enzyme